MITPYFRILRLIFYRNCSFYSRSDPFEPIVFEFDRNILSEYKGTLEANKLALDDFTEESLTQT